MIILRVRALATNHTKERTSERLTQIPLSRAKMKEMSRVSIINILINFSLGTWTLPTLNKQGLGLVARVTFAHRRFSNVTRAGGKSCNT